MNTNTTPTITEYQFWQESTNTNHNRGVFSYFAKGCRKIYSYENQKGYIKKLIIHVLGACYGFILGGAMVRYQGSSTVYTGYNITAKVGERYVGKNLTTITTRDYYGQQLMEIVAITASLTALFIFMIGCLPMCRTTQRENTPSDV